MNNNTHATTFRDYFRVVYRYKIIFIMLLAVVMPITYYKLQFQTPLYRASVMMMVKAQKGTEASYYKGIFYSKNLSQDLAMLVTSNIVLERVVKALKLHEYPGDYEKKYTTPLKAKKIEARAREAAERMRSIPPERAEVIRFNSAVGWLNSVVAAVPLEDSSMFQIIVRDYDPGRAVSIANSVSRSYVIFDLEQQIVELQLKYGDKHSTVLQLKKYIEEFSKTLDGQLLPDIEAIGPASIKIIQQARKPEPLMMISTNRKLVIMFFICLLVSIVISFGLEFLNQKIRTPHDIESFLKLNFLGSIVKIKPSKGPVHVSDLFDNSDYVKSIQVVADRIYMQMKEKGFKSLLLTDVEGAEESIVTIASLSTFFADRQGLKVLVVDANLRSDSFKTLFDVSEESHGLSDMMETGSSLDEYVQEVSSHLHVLTSGHPVANPIPFLQSLKLAEIIEEAKKNYDIVLVHSAELSGYGDSVILSDLVDGFVLILDEGKNRRIIVKNAIAPLEQKDANIIGAVLNNRKYVLPSLIYKIT